MLTLSDAKEMVKLNTRRFAKRQMTWFRSFPDVQWSAAEEREGRKLFLKNYFFIRKNILGIA